MHQRARALWAGAAALVVASLLTGLTGCGAQRSQAPTADLLPAAPSPSAPATAATPQERVDTATCFDVAEAYSGLELLPLTDQDGDGDEGDDDALAQARESLTSVREHLPEDVQPAFDDVRAVLEGAGDTLQPREAVQLHRALEPAESWLQANCASTPSG